MKEVNKKARKWWNYELTTSEREGYFKRAGKELEMVDIDFVMESYTKEHKEMKKECNCKAANKSPKPMLVVSLPYSASVAGYQNIKESLYERGIGDDYHLLVINSGKEETSTEVFYEKDFNKVKFEELKEIVENSLKK